MNKLLLSIIGVAIIVAGVLWYFHPSEPIEPIKGVSEGNQYNATSTAASNGYGAITGDQLIKTGWGTFGSLVITGANTGVMNFYNATTSDITKRTGNKATTTLLITSIPASLTAGTYVFDAIFTNGLLLELENGIMPTTTILHR